MATAQLFRHKQKTGTWSNIFPTDQVTPQQSGLFVKKLLALAVSNITYLRTIFPDHAFGDRCLEDLNLKILRDDSACPGACQVIKWVKGCFDALDRKYLRMIIMSIYKDEQDPDTIVESYTFKFFYKDDRISIFRNGSKITQATSPNQTRRATITLLRTIVVLTQTLKPLPDEAMMSMKLFYYDEITPPDYEPPGFEAVNDDSDYHFMDEPLNIKVGEIHTSFHSIKLRIKTDCQQFALDDDEEEGKGKDISKDEDVTLQLEEEETAKASTSIATESSPLHEAEVMCEGGSDSSPSLIGNPLTTCTTVVDSDALIVRCPCEYNEDEGLMILCEACHHWQHANCFGLRGVEEVPESHFCDLCHKTTASSTCTDPKLVKMAPSDRRLFCLWRRLLILCLSMNRIIAHALAKKMSIELDVAQSLVSRLEKEGFVQTPPKGNTRQWKTVLKDIIQSIGLKKYFSSEMERPVEEELHSATEINEPSSNTGVSGVATSNSSAELRSEPVEHLSDLTGKTSSMNLQPPPQISVADSNAKGVVRRSPRIAAKRARSLADPTIEFEISDSQEVGVTGPAKGRKRRKISIVSRSILV